MADPLRIAAFNAALSRDGPGLLPRDIVTGKARQVEAAAEIVARGHPDILLVTGIDYDLDLDGDGRLGGHGDAQGFGAFSGQGGMAILSRWPIGAATDYSGFLWREVPGALIEGAGLRKKAKAAQRLSTNGHWAVPVEFPDGSRLTLLAHFASPPVFDGPEDLNRCRNHDEAAFWTRLLDRELPFTAPEPPYVLLGDANLDPVDGEGRPDALLRRLRDPRLQDARASLRGRGRGGAPSGQSQYRAAPPRAGRCGTAPGGAGRRPDPLLQRLILGWPI